MSRFPINHGVLQSDLDADNNKILNADLSDSSNTFPSAVTAPHTNNALRGDGAGGISNSKIFLTQPATLATLTLLNGKTFQVSNTLTLEGTDGSTLNVGTGGTLGTAALTAASAYATAAQGSSVDAIKALSGLLKSNGSAVSAATAKTDYWDTTVAVASGASHAKGLVPDPGVTGGTTKFLREDMTYAVPPASAGVVIASTTLVIKGDNAGGGVAATPGTLTGDYVAPSTAFGRLLAATTAIISTANAYTINWNTTTSWTHTLTEDVTYAFSNPTDTWSIIVTILNSASNYTVTWPSGIKWPTGVAPTMTLGAKYDVYGFIKQGSVIQGLVSQNHS